MLKKIQLLSLCVCALAASQVNAADKTATINAKLDILAERVFTDATKELVLSSDSTVSTPVELTLDGNKNADLTITSTKGALKTSDDSASVAYDLQVTTDGTTAVGVKPEEILSTAATPTTFDVLSTVKLITVAANVRSGQTLAAGSYADTLTLTLTDK